jgi:hypothetical protein
MYGYVIFVMTTTQEKIGVGQTHFIGQRVMHHSKKMTDLWHLLYIILQLIIDVKDCTHYCGAHAQVI